MCSYLCFGMAFRHYLSFAFSVVLLLIVKVDTISHMASIIFARTPSKFQRQPWCIGVYIGVVVYMSMVPVSPAPSLSSAVNNIFGGLNRETSFGCLTAWPHQPIIFNFRWFRLFDMLVLWYEDWFVVHERTDLLSRLVTLPQSPWFFTNASVNCLK